MTFRQFASVSVMAILAGPVAAQSLNDLLAPQPENAKCWQREYSDAHMASHPEQKVSLIRFELDYYEMEFHETGAGDYAFGIVMTAEGREGWAGGLCYEDAQDGVSCAADCDGGAVAVRNARQVGSLLVELTSGGMRLSGCGDDTDFWVSSEPYDKLFLVHPIDCPVE